MKTKLLVSTALALLLCVSPAGAQFGGSIVYDPSAVSQLITQVSYQLQMINQLAQQVQQGQNMLQSLSSNIVPGLSGMIQQSQSLVSSLNGISSTGSSLTSLLNSQYPTDFSNLSTVSAILGKIATMQTQARQATQNSMTLQGQVASNQPQIAAAMQSATERFQCRGRSNRCAASHKSNAHCLEYPNRGFAIHPHWSHARRRRTAPK